MKRRKRLSLLIISAIAASSLLMTGCVKQQATISGPEDTGKTENTFDYSTTTNTKLDIDYSLKGNKALFEVYDQNPLTSVNGNVIKKEGVKAILKGYTGTDGKYSGLVNLPTATEKVYIYTDTYGFPTCVSAEVKENGISLNMQERLEELFKTQNGKSGSNGPKGGTSATNPYNIQFSGTWSNNGSPDYVIGEWHYGWLYPTYVDPMPEGLSYRVHNVLLPGKDNSALAKPTEVVNTKIIADAKVKLVFFGELSAYRNAIGYYYYDTQNPPKTREEFDKLPKYIAFPNCSMFSEDPFGESGVVGSYMPPLYPGEQMYLKYYGKEIFPKGTTIGWFIIPDGFEVSNNGTGKLNITGPKHGIRYSNNEFNEGGARYCVSVYDKPSGKTIIGFEDSGDFDLKDVMVYLETTPEGAISNPDSPSTGPDGEYPNITGDAIEGTLVFEDLWPSKGDYDMNDVVIGYSTTFTTDKNNRIIKIQDVFTPLHNGGQMASAFGYQLDLQSSDIKSVKVENGSSTAYTINGMEAKQNKPTIMLWNNMKDAVNKGAVTVIVELSGNVQMEKVTRKSLYNPFICVNSKEFFPGRIRKEVHLTNYEPTAIANPSFFGKNDDKTPVDKNGNPIGPYYYIASESYPFAIDIPVTNYRIPTEMVKIDNFYPEFPKWVSSSGTDNKEWYKNAVK